MLASRMSWISAHIVLFSLIGSFLGTLLGRLPREYPQAVLPRGVYAR